MSLKEMGHLDIPVTISDNVISYMTAYKLFRCMPAAIVKDYYAYLMSPSWSTLTRTIWQIGARYQALTILFYILTAFESSCLSSRHHLITDRCVVQTTWVLQPSSSLGCYSVSLPWSKWRAPKDDHPIFISHIQAFKRPSTLTNTKDCSVPMSWKCVFVENILRRMDNNAADPWKFVFGDLNVAVRTIIWNRPVDAIARTMNGPVRHSFVLPWVERLVLRNHRSDKTLAHSQYARRIWRVRTKTRRVRVAM